MWILLETVTDITAAQILAMSTTPVEIVPAPDAGSVIVPVAISWAVRPGSVPFSGAGSVTTAFGGGASGPYTTFAPGLNATVETIGNAVAPSGAAAAATTRAGHITASLAAPVTSGNGVLSILCKYYWKKL
jgi:hypothetical protein